MPNVERTPRQSVRVSDALWDAFGHVVGMRDRSRIVREFIAWYVRTPGAKLPKRPPITAHEERP